MNTNYIIMVGIISIAVTAMIHSSATAQDDTTILPEEIYDIHAMARPIEGSIVIPGDPEHIIKEIPVEYIITVKGSPSYNVISRHNLEVTLNLRTPNTIDVLTLDRIKEYSVTTWGYTMPAGHILFQPYV